MYLNKRIVLTLSLTAFFFVSRLTAVGHIRHPKKTTLLKMKTILVSVCASVCPNESRQTHSNRAKEVAFNVFHYNCRPSI